MAGRLVIVLSAVVVVATPVVLVGNAVWLLMQPWLVDAQYALPGFPVDPLGPSAAQRAALAKDGLRAVRPGGEGVAVLEALRVDGRPAFAPREIRHLRDVEHLVGGLLVAWAAALAMVVAAGFALRALGPHGEARRAAQRGAALTAALMAALGLGLAFAFDRTSTALHALAFDGRSWRFGDDDMLRRLFPDVFWVVAGLALAALVLAQAGAILAVLGGRRTGRARG